ADRYEPKQGPQPYCQYAECGGVPVERTRSQPDAYATQNPRRNHSRHRLGFPRHYERANSCPHQGR
ncbi:hypothetical protein, partial [Fischerella thermalis]|uniref:hypothetical protein n=1 Tax=Fischerella thermalis TaxID=372787 RepID=UPI0015E07427